MKNMIFLSIASTILAACSSAAISDISQDKVVVEGRFSGPDDKMVVDLAGRGCGLYGKVPVYLSWTCLDGNCLTKKYLFACKAAEGFSTPLSKAPPVAQSQLVSTTPTTSSAQQSASVQSQPTSLIYCNISGYLYVASETQCLAYKGEQIK